MANDLHAEIMNIQCSPPERSSGELRVAYKLGHRDARHAAAELAALPPVAGEAVEFPFYELRFIMRVLGHEGKAPKQDWATAYGMARSIFMSRHPALSTLPAPSPAAVAGAIDAREQSPEAATVEQCIVALTEALVQSKGWMHDYADSIVRDAVDRKHLMDEAPAAGAIDARGQEAYTIEGTVTFTRSDAATQVCVCCPKGGGHIFGRRVQWDAYKTNRPDHFGTSANVFVDSRITDFNGNEGRRVRLTVELLPVACEQGEPS